MTPSKPKIKVYHWTRYYAPARLRLDLFWRQMNVIQDDHIAIFIHN